jgi:excinuclease UvrABC nuclease subunit
MKNNNSNFSFVPAATHEDLIQNKGKILKENKGKSGIYMFKNLITGQVYIGSAQDISKRYSEYSRISYLKMSSSMYILRRKHYHTSTTPTIHPLFVTGFADAESSFILLINQNSQNKTGYSLQASFAINLHKKNRALLENIASFYGVGNITKAGVGSILYRVTSLKDINRVIIPHFDKYPLISQKRVDFEL